MDKYTYGKNLAAVALAEILKDDPKNRRKVKCFLDKFSRHIKLLKQTKDSKDFGYFSMLVLRDYLDRASKRWVNLECLMFINATLWTIQRTSRREHHSNNKGL